MPNFFERLSHPKYEQGGRFNVLSIPELIYSFTRPGGQEIDRQLGLRNRGQEALVAGQEADVRRTGAVTGNLEANTKGQDISNIIQEINRRMLQRNADRQIKNDLKFDLEYPGTTPEFMRFEQEQRNFNRDSRVADAKADEALGLVGGTLPKYPLTEAGQSAQSLAAGTQARAAQEQGESERSKQNAAAHILGAAAQFSPDIMPALGQMLSKLGYPVMNFKPVQDDRSIAADIEASRAGALGKPSAGVPQGGVRTEQLPGSNAASGIPQQGPALGPSGPPGFEAKKQMLDGWIQQFLQTNGRVPTVEEARAVLDGLMGPAQAPQAPQGPQAPPSQPAQVPSPRPSSGTLFTHKGGGFSPAAKSVAGKVGTGAKAVGEGTLDVLKFLMEMMGEVTGGVSGAIDEENRKRGIK